MFRINKNENNEGETDTFKTNQLCLKLYTQLGGSPSKAGDEADWANKVKL